MAKDPSRWRCIEHKLLPVEQPNDAGLGSGVYSCGKGCSCHNGLQGELYCHFETIPEEDFVDPGAPAYEDLPPEAHLPMEDDLKALGLALAWLSGFTQGGGGPFGEEIPGATWVKAGDTVLMCQRIVDRLKGGRDE